MRVIGLQRRFRELGRIRLGHQVGDDKKKRPEKLTAFRLTSASEPLLQAASAIYGGEVKPWADAPNEGYFELFTDADALDIAIPPTAEPYTQAYELWSGGGCQRRCDGVTAVVAQANGIRERPCVCDPDGEGLAAGERECALVTRVNVMLPRLPDVGVWRLETHGINAALELPGTLDLLGHFMEGGRMLVGRLRIEPRTKKVPGEKFPRRFIVPVIDLGVTMSELIAGDAAMPQIGGPAPTPTGRPALPAGPSAPVDPEPVPVAEEFGAGMGAPPPLPVGDATKKPERPPPSEKIPVSPPRRSGRLADPDFGGDPGSPAPHPAQTTFDAA